MDTVDYKKLGFLLFSVLLLNISVVSSFVMSCLSVT